MAVPLLVGSAVAFNKDLEGRKKALYTYIFTALFALGVAVSFSILGLVVAKFGGFFSVAPLWAYIVAGSASMLIALYALGFLGEVDKSVIIRKLIPYRLFGGFLIGLIFGVVTSAPLFAIISLASSSGYVYAYAIFEDDITKCILKATHRPYCFDIFQRHQVGDEWINYLIFDDFW